MPIISNGFTVPTLPPSCQLILNVTKPRPFTHLAGNLYGSSSKNVCVPMPTHSTIMYFGFHVMWIDGVKCGLFRITHRLGRPHYVWDEYLYSVREKVEVRVTVRVSVCVVLLCCVGCWWKEGRRWNPVPAHSLLFSKSTKGAAKFSVPIRRTNRYQLYYMPSQHTYCGRVWNLIQDCDTQFSD